MIYAYVILNASASGGDDIVPALRAQVRKVIGPIATPDSIQIVAALPKTRSGKIMRRILRKIAAAEYEELGDLSTLADPGVVPTLVDGHRSSVQDS